MIWSKPNGLPESVTDRVRRSHETWFHLVKQPRYYSAVDRIRERHTRIWSAPGGSGNPGASLNEGRKKNGTLATCDPNPLGALPGSVWTIPTQPLKVPAELGIDHFAAFPMEWPRRIIEGWSPAGICTACGEARRPVIEKGTFRSAGHPGRPYDQNDGRTLGALRHGLDGSTLRQVRDAYSAGEACACADTSASTTPAVVLDPFGGTGTTALVAASLGRRGVSVDLSADYCRLARWRTADPGQRAAALLVEKPPVQTTGQATLFDLAG